MNFITEKKQEIISKIIDIEIEKSKQLKIKISKENNLLNKQTKTVSDSDIRESCIVTFMMKLNLLMAIR